MRPNVSRCASRGMRIPQSLALGFSLILPVRPIHHVNPMMMQPFCKVVLKQRLAEQLLRLAVYAINTTRWFLMGVLTGQTQVKLPTLTEPDCSGLPTFTSDRPADGSTFQPGIYTNGIHLNGNDSFSFDPGLYCLDGEFQINSKNAAAVGNAVTFFMRGNSGLHFNGGDIDLRAPHNNEWKDGANRYWNGMALLFRLWKYQ